MRIAMAILSVVRFLKSRTSQNGVVGVGMVVAVLEALRARWPEYVLWSPEADTLIEGAVIAVLGPYLGRLVAFLRNPDKLRRAGILALLLCIGAGLGGLQGCSMTRELADGSTVTVTVDAEQVEAALDRIEQYQARREAAEARGDEEAQARLDRRIAAAQELLRELREGD